MMRVAAVASLGETMGRTETGGLRAESQTKMF
jgi:hypothetical protein